MSNKTFKDGYKPGDIILDEDTGILYDPRYGYPRTHDRRVVLQIIE